MGDESAVQRGLVVDETTTLGSMRLTQNCSNKY